MLQRKRTGITPVSPCSRPIQTEGQHQHSERKHPNVFPFYTLYIPSNKLKVAMVDGSNSESYLMKTCVNAD